MDANPATWPRGTYQRPNGATGYRKVRPSMLAALRAGGQLSDDFRDVMLGPEVPIRRERDLFDFLSVSYVPPHMRGVLK
jgi:hypothetical protein